jgi:ribosomal protein S18 acetylase RimI-like enzyme
VVIYLLQTGLSLFYFSNIIVEKRLIALVEIREVTSKKDLKRFINFPHQLYSGNPYWVPSFDFDELNTLLSDRNPAFAHCEAKYWLAFKNGNIVGRIAGIINHLYNETWKKKRARFGWIDFIDDPEVSAALISTVEKWALEKGLEEMNGPMGFCEMDREGMLVEGFGELATLATIYNYPYYPRHIEALGYQKEVDAVEYEIKTPQQIPEKVEKINQVLMKRGKYSFVNAKKPKDLLPYADGVFGLINQAYKDLYGVVPLNDAQIKAFTKQYFGFVKPDFVKVIIDQNKQVVAFGITMPSLSRALQKSRGKLFPFGFIHILKAMKRNDTLDLYLIAVRPDLQHKGINSLLLTEITRAAIEHAIVKAETNPELESNSKVQSQWKHYESRQHKRRRFYIKQLK